MTDDSTELMTSVARMYYLDGLDQQTIAGTVGVSRSTVSRLLTTARERGIVRITVEDFDPRDQALEHQLVERFGLRRAIVVKAFSGTVESVRRTIGYYAGPVIAGLIASSMRVGVTGGRTLAEVVQCASPQERPRDVAVLQLMGNVGPSVSRIDGIEVCRTLAHQVGGTQFTLNVPAILQNDQTRDLLLAHQHVRILRGFFASLDLALVGIGSLDNSMFVDNGALAAEDFECLRAAGAVGETCGRFFDRDGRECDTDFRRRVISINFDELRRCPEVFGVTNGTNRTAALRAAIAGKLVTSLIIDVAAAAALLDQAQPAPPATNGSVGIVR